MRLTVLLAVSLCATAWSVAAAWAGVVSPRCHPLCTEGDAGAGPNGIRVDAGADGGPGGGGPGQSVIHGPDHDPCTYRSLSAHGFLAWRISYAWQGNGDPPEPPPDQYYGDDPDTRWAVAHCPANSDRDVLAWWAIGQRPPARLIDALRLRARDAVPFPVMAQQGAPTGERDAPFITQLPTWLWVDPATWHPVHAQAAIPGIVTVTAIGTPTHLTWNPGTGDPPLTCDGPGEPYDQNRPDAAQVTTCAYTYHHSSSLAPGHGPYQLEMGVEWSVEWQCTPGCGGGPMAPVTVTTTRSVWVAELQALTKPAP
jgi:hypothetical protein